VSIGLDFSLKTHFLNLAAAQTPSLSRRSSIMKSLVLAVAAMGSLAAGARAANPVVVMDTSMGPIKIELNEDKAPITVKNFLSYVDDKFYDNTIFHRVIGKENSERDFMIQGGGYTTEKKQKDTKPPIKNESSNGLSNTRGTIAMARTSNPNSATAQFYINVGDNSFLDRAGGGYTVFGKVIEGMDVVDKIKAVKTGASPIEQMTVTGAKQMSPTPNVPDENIVIKSVRRVDAK
jgi:cyclophilin family peptidyl-prolyl cis-trans isomerase